MGIQSWCLKVGKKPAQLIRLDNQLVYHLLSDKDNGQKLCMVLVEFTTIHCCLKAYANQDAHVLQALWRMVQV